MFNAIVNYKLHGFEEKDILDLKEATKDWEIGIAVIVLNSETIGNERCYYSAIKNLCTLGTKVIIINLEGENECFKMLAAMMLSYNQYNIYSVKNKSYLSADYIESLCEREADYSEVQTYIDGDITAFSELGTIFIGIESLVKDGSIEALKDFLESHVNSVENISASIDFLKKNVDLNRSEELTNTINELQNKLDKIEDAKADVENQLKITEKELKNSRQEAETNSEEARTLKMKYDSLMEQSTNGGVVINSYIETNVAMLHCKAKIIIYFKEISYINYMNSFITNLVGRYKASQKKVKLVIYDRKNSISCMYNPLQIVGTQEYLQDKNSLINKQNSFVVIEPNPQIIQDVLQSNEAYDIVIIYDRLKEANDIVIGNNVTKFFVVNSRTDLEQAKGIMRVTDKSPIFVREGTSIQHGMLFPLATIPDYRGGNESESARVSQYIKKLRLPNNKLLLEEFDTVSRVANI